eukprot:scaffold18376_cov160-Skeletonema_menzelii.AAC.8
MNLIFVYLKRLPRRTLDSIASSRIMVCCLWDLQGFLYLKTCVEILLASNALARSIHTAKNADTEELDCQGFGIFVPNFRNAS